MEEYQQDAAVPPANRRLSELSDSKTFKKILSAYPGLYVIPRLDSQDGFEINRARRLASNSNVDLWQWIPASLSRLNRADINFWTHLAIVPKVLLKTKGFRYFQDQITQALAAVEKVPFLAWHARQRRYVMCCLPAMALMSDKLALSYQCSTSVR